MLRSAEYIIRRAGGNLRPGELVVASDRYQERMDEQLLGFSLGRPDVLLWIPVVQLLPLTEYLHRQPVSAYWMLAHRKSLRRNEPNAYLAYPQGQHFGPCGFRFESLGELCYYLKDKRLAPSAFQAVFTSLDFLNAESQHGNQRERN